MSYHALAQIELEAILHNLTKLKSYAPRSKILAMVKANAYGHGLIAVAKALEHADALGVARIQEGLQLRSAGIQTPIVLMEGILQDWELPLVSEHQFILVVHQWHQINLLRNSNLNKAFDVWIKIDTGMHRLGFPGTALMEVYQSLLSTPAIKSVIGVMSHFASADEKDNPCNAKQMQEFKTICQNLPLAKSLANSAGILSWPDSHYDWVRPGIMLYGVSPFANTTGQDLGFKPAMRLVSRVIAINDYQKGDLLGYNGTYSCPENMKVGVVAIGYGDGYPRYLYQPTPIMVNGIKTTIVGRVSMDMLAVDLRPIPNAQLGDEVELWGPHLPIENIATAAQTSPYELLTGLTSRVEHQY